MIARTSKPEQGFWAKENAEVFQAPALDAWVAGRLPDLVRAAPRDTVRLIKLLQSFGYRLT